MSYNGWTNRATWLVNLWLGDSVAEYVADTSGEKITAEQFECYVLDVLHQDGATVEGGLAADLMGFALGNVNWHELAEHANEGVAENA